MTRAERIEELATLFVKANHDRIVNLYLPGYYALRSALASTDEATGSEPKAPPGDEYRRGVEDAAAFLERATVLMPWGFGPLIAKIRALSQPADAHAGTTTNVESRVACDCDWGTHNWHREDCAVRKAATATGFTKSGDAHAGTKEEEP